MEEDTEWLKPEPQQSLRIFEGENPILNLGQKDVEKHILVPFVRKYESRLCASKLSEWCENYKHRKWNKDEERMANTPNSGSHVAKVFEKRCKATLEWRKII